MYISVEQCLGLNTSVQILELFQFPLSDIRECSFEIREGGGQMISGGVVIKVLTLFLRGLKFLTLVLGDTNFLT